MQQTRTIFCSTTFFQLPRPAPSSNSLFHLVLPFARRTLRRYATPPVLHPGAVKIVTAQRCWSTAIFRPFSSAIAFAAGSFLTLFLHAFPPLFQAPFPRPFLSFLSCLRHIFTPCVGNKLRSHNRCHPKNSDAAICPAAATRICSAPPVPVLPSSISHASCVQLAKQFSVSVVPQIQFQWLVSVRCFGGLFRRPDGWPIPENCLFPSSLVAASECLFFLKSGRVFRNDQ